MKKITALLLGLMLVFSATACTTTKTDNSETTKVEESSSGDNQSIEVDENLLTVEITIPASYFEDEDEPVTQESLEEEIAEVDGIKEVKLNDDGSVTYKMTKAKQKEMLKEMQTSIDEGLQKMIDDDSYSFTEINHNDDYTEFEVKTTSTSLGLYDTIATLGFYLYGGYYNAFAGNEIDDVVVKYINVDSGEIVDECHMKDMEDDE